MGIPVNEQASHKGCEPKASTCIIWQGKDIDCLDICSGASIDDVIYQLGCLVCTIKDQLDVDTYDLTCLSAADCDVPHTFRELMQYLIGIICQLKDGYLNGPAEGIASEELIIAVASCFQGTLGVNATISDYIVEIGNQVCTNTTEIANLSETIIQMQAEINILKA